MRRKAGANGGSIEYEIRAGHRVGEEGERGRRRRRREGIALGRPNEAVQNGERGRWGRCGPAEWGRGGSKEHNT